MNEDLYTKLFMAFCGAAIAIALKILIDYIYRRIELKRIKLVLVNDLAHQCHSAALFIREKERIYEIYRTALDGYSIGIPQSFHEKLQSTLFGEVFFSDETFKTIKKADLLSILRKKKKKLSFGELHNIYHISNNLKHRNLTFYEDLFDEHFLAYCGENKSQTNIIAATQRALEFITMRLETDMKNSMLLFEMSSKYLSHLVNEKMLKEKLGIEKIKPQNESV